MSSAIRWTSLWIHLMVVNQLWTQLSSSTFSHKPSTSIYLFRSQKCCPNHGPESSPKIKEKRLRRDGGFQALSSPLPPDSLILGLHNSVALFHFISDLSWDTIELNRTAHHTLSSLVHEWLFSFYVLIYVFVHLCISFGRRGDEERWLCWSSESSVWFLFLNAKLNQRCFFSWIFGSNLLTTYSLAPILLLSTYFGDFFVIIV